MMQSDLQAWFVSDILPHQPALTRYLRRLCRSANEVPDLRQETYFRLYESASRSGSRLPTAFLFTTARNLVIDKLRRKRADPVNRITQTDDLACPVDELTPERRLAAGQELQRLTRAFNALPEKTRSAIWLRRVEGLSQREAARSLGMDEGALEGHMSRGMRSLAQIVSIHDRSR
jgi:RNA polymerase sigma-70 factor (ECF subfamily)